jgi:GR25 family glycosyltransferase involved in LPS biosynthesis
LIGNLKAEIEWSESKAGDRRIMFMTHSLNIHVISLDSSIERRNRFATNNSHLDYEFFSAIDGDMMSSDVIKDPSRFVQPLYYSSGAYGCALSHLALWEKAIAREEWLTIIEDDAILRYDFSSAVKCILGSIPPDTDIVLWGWNFDAVLSIKVMESISPVLILLDQDAMRNGIDRFQSSRDEVRPFRLDQCFGTPAYSISPAGAQRLKSICFPIRDFVLESPLSSSGIRNNGIDIVMNQIYALIQAYVCFPPLALTPNISEESTIAKLTPQRHSS